MEEAKSTEVETVRRSVTKQDEGTLSIGDAQGARQDFTRPGFLGCYGAKNRRQVEAEAGIQVSGEHCGTLRKIICLKTKEFWIQIRKAPFSYDTMELRKNLAST